LLSVNLSQKQVVELAGVVKNVNNEKLKSEVKQRFNKCIEELVQDEESAGQAQELAKKYRDIFGHNPKVSMPHNQ
jgi:hypothetical protein